MTPLTPPDREFSPVSTSKLAIETALILGLYAAVVFGSRYLIEENPDSQLIKLTMLLTLIPIGLMVAGVVRFYRGLDEMKQKMHLEALAFSFSLTAAITLSVGLLEGELLPQLSWAWVCPLMAVLNVVGTALACRRYS